MTLTFRVGERVSFQPEGQPLLTGVITKYNRKTVTVLTEHGQHWNVAPTFLRPAPSAEDTSRLTTGQVIRLPITGRKGRRA